MVCWIVPRAPGSPTLEESKDGWMDKHDVFCLSFYALSVVWLVASEVPPVTAAAAHT